MAIEFSIEIQNWDNDGGYVVAYMRLSEFSAEDIMFTQVIPATETSEKSVSSIIIPRAYMRAVIERLAAASVLDIRESDERCTCHERCEVAGSDRHFALHHSEPCPTHVQRQTGLDDDPLPPCVLAMGCYCAGHARGNPVDEPCDTSEAVAT